MSGQARATLLSGLGKEIQRRQLDGLIRWAKARRRARRDLRAMLAKAGKSATLAKSRSGS